MFEQVIDKDFLAQAVQQVKNYIDNYQPDDVRRDADGNQPDPFDPVEAAESIETAQEHLSLPDPHAPVADRRDAGAVEKPAAYIPSSAELCNLQAAIERHFLEKKTAAIQRDSPVATDRRDGGPHSITGERLILPNLGPGRPDDMNRLFGPFEQTDVGWISSLFAMGVRLFHKRHPYVPRPVRGDVPISLPDDKLRVIVFGDWGTGVPRAKEVSSQIRLQLDDPSVAGWQKHVVHLGDVYYAGWDFEYRQRFLNDWPVKPEEKDTIGSFTLNGNHDMYAGGWGFYDVALADPRFAAWQGKSSLFHLQNTNWQIFGLDTSWDDAGLKGDQTDWLRGAIDAGRKTLFLSHHQYCSVYEKAAQNLVTLIDPVLASAQIKSWLWGHEHRCMTYEKVKSIEYPRCIGHAGVPVYQNHQAGDPVPSPGEWEYRGWVPGTLPVEHMAKFGFTVLDFHNDRIDVKYINEDGGVDCTETIV